MVLVDDSSGESIDLFDSGGMHLTDHEAERNLIGILLNKPAAITETIEILRPADVHDPFLRRIYEVLLEGYERGESVSCETIVASLGGEKGAGAFIASLASDAETNANIGEIADQLQQVAERRATGAADDIMDNRPFVSKFGAQAWEDIGTAGAAACYSWLVEDVLPLGEIAMAFGDTGTGKSFNVFDMAMAIARAQKWNGFNVEAGLVIYVAAEAGKGFAKRKIAYATQHKLESSEPLPFVLLTKRPNFFQDDVDVTALIAEIEAIRRRYNQQLVLIVLDTMSAVTQGMDEISGKDQAMVRKRLLLLQEPFGATVLVVHHKPKAGGGPRGHGSITADIETTIEYETVTDRKTAEGLTIHKATLRKQREGKSGVFWQFTLPVVEVGRNKWGNPDTSCVVAPYAVGTRQAPVGFHANSNEKLYLRALFDAIIDHGQPPPAALPKSITKVVEARHVRERMRERFISGYEDNKVTDTRFRQAYSRAGNVLRDGKVIGVQGEWLWPTGKPVNGFEIKETT